MAVRSILPLRSHVNTCNFPADEIIVVYLTGTKGVGHYRESAERVAGNAAPALPGP